MNGTPANMEAQNTGFGASFILLSAKGLWKSGLLKITGNDVGEAPVLPALLAQIPEEEDITSGTADGLTTPDDVMKPIADRGA